MLKDVNSEAFRTQSEDLGRRYVVRLDGCLDLETNPLFVEFLQQLTPTLKTERWQEIEFDCRSLYLMSSCAISTLATWVTAVQSSRPRCHIAFVTDPNLKWQARTLDGICRLAPALVSIDPASAASHRPTAAVPSTTGRSYPSK